MTERFFTRFVRPRAIFVNSWYLTSFCIPLFLQIRFHSKHPLRNTNSISQLEKRGLSCAMSFFGKRGLSLNLKTKPEMNLYKFKIIYSGGITSFHLKSNINYNVFLIVFNFGWCSYGFRICQLRVFSLPVHRYHLSLSSI